MNQSKFAQLEDPLALPNNPESEESFNEQSDGGEDGSNDDSKSQNDDEYVGPVLPGGHRFDKKMICIKYPGNVINPDKAIKTLGDLADISSTVDNKNRRMELRFRPDDGYCNPTCGDRNETVGFLLRVRVKKSRRDKVESAQSSTSKLDENNSKEKRKDTKEDSRQENDSEMNDNDSDKNKPPTFDREKYENLSKDPDYQLPKLKVLGRIDTEFRFTSLCDFQYVPITKNLKDPTKDECIYDQIYPVGLPPISWMDNEVPYFLPPAAFSRMDTMQQYVPKPEAPNNNHSIPDVIGRTRKRRGGFSNFISFHTPYVPTSPPKGIETALKVKFLQSTHVERMRKLFDIRPIWSKTALRHLTKFSNEQLKVLLPAVAYYFMTGPWRITWVKLGYDPRKDPESRKYQTLDFRMKGTDGLLSNVQCKRSYSDVMLKNRNVPNTKPRTTVLMPNSSLQPQKKRIVLDENVYIFRPGMIPPSRQMFYQYCDVHVKEIQEMLEKYKGPPPGTPCHEKMGWLPSNFDDHCREIISKNVRIELRKMMNIPENHPTSLPRKPKVLSEKTIRKRKKKAQVSVNAAVENTVIPVVNTTDQMEVEEEEEEYDYGEEYEAQEGLEENENEVDDDGGNKNGNEDVEYSESEIYGFENGMGIYVMNGIEGYDEDGLESNEKDEN